MAHNRANAYNNMKEFLRKLAQDKGLLREIKNDILDAKAELKRLQDERALLEKEYSLDKRDAMLVIKEANVGYILGMEKEIENLNKTITIEREKAAYVSNFFENLWQEEKNKN